MHRLLFTLRLPMLLAVAALICLSGAGTNAQPKPKPPLGGIKIKPPVGKIKLPPLKAMRPGKHALVVLLENGGISSSLKAVFKSDLPKIPVAKCGSFSFELKKGESIPQLIQRVFSQIAAHPECLNPLNWRIEMVPAEGLIDPVTDYLAEEFAKFVIQIDGASTKYDKVVVLQNAKFTAAGVMAEIKKLAPNYVLDIHVLSHGTTDKIIGYNGAVLNTASFFKPLMDLKAAKKLNLYIRTVYQINCRSGSVVQEWRDLGAEAVAGTSGAKMQYMPNQYLHFLSHWLNGKTFNQAVTLGFNEGKMFLEPLYVVLGHPEYTTDSRLFVTGTGSLKVTSP
jgi:hypothetical protein